MKILQQALLVLALNYSVSAFGSAESSNELEIISARLQALYNFKVEYDVNQFLIPPSPKIQAHLEEVMRKQKPEDGFSLLEEGTKKMRNTFQFLGGMARYESIIIERKRNMLPKDIRLREIDSKVLVVTAGRQEQLIHKKDIHRGNGIIYQAQDKLSLPPEIQVCLGLSYPWKNTYLDSAQLQKMDINSTDDRMVVMRDTNSGKQINEWTFDKELGYALVSYRNFSATNNQLNMEATMTDFKSVNNIMLPSKAIMRRYCTIDSNSTLIEESSFNVREYKLDDPCNMPGTYKISWPDDTIVHDRKVGLSFLYANHQMLLKNGAIYDVILNDIDKTISNIVKEAIMPVNVIFIPKISVALAKGDPYVFDLASGQFLYSTGDINSEQAHENFIEFGKGDIAWNDLLITVRNAKALNIKNKQSPLEYIKSDWCTRNKLPQKVSLPYSLLIVSKESINYFVTIHKVETDGIKITYKKITADQAKLLI